jgi:alcohol dehydrogenase class IV
MPPTIAPVKSFDFVAPPQIVFGWGRRSEIGALARPLGARAWLVVGSRNLAASGAVAEIESSLRAAGVESARLVTISREPEIDDVDRTVSQLRAVGVRAGDLVVGLGGGSAIDLAKAVAALAVQTESGSVHDYLEGVGRSFKLRACPLPVLAVPTTAGTGSEATKNAVISSFDPPFKKSLRDQRMVPRAVLIDPELAVSLPRDATVHTGLDAITQLIESYVSCRAQPLAQALALEGLRRAAPAIERVAADGTDRAAREAMAYAALLSGLALANSGLGLAHGVAAALGVHCRVPHGLACAVMLPTAIRVNRPVREAELAVLAGALMPDKHFNSTAYAADAAVAEVERLTAALGIPRRLGQLGASRDQIPALVCDSRGNSMSGNPRELSDTELTRLLEEML